MICMIEKVASSELKKLIYRMQGDDDWRREPWFKPGLKNIRKDYPKLASTIMNDPSWTKVSPTEG